MEESVGYVAILIDQLHSMGTGFIRLLPQMIIALIFLMLTWLVAKGGRKIANRISEKAKIRPSLAELVHTVVNVAIWLIGLMVVMTIILPGVTPGSLLAGLGIGAVAIGFAFQDIFENFLAGVLIMVREKMRIGDIIECDGMTGKVEQISLRETHLRRLSGELTIVPNSILFKNPVEIFTDLEQRRHEIIAGVSYDTDLDHAQKVIKAAVAKADNVDADKRIDVFACAFNSSSVDFNVRWWAGSKPFDMHQSRDNVIRSIKRALDEAGIEIPFPYVTHTFKEALTVDRSDRNASQNPAQNEA